MITTNTLLFFFTLAVVFMLITMLVVKHKLDYFFNNATKNYFINFGLVVGIGLIIFSIYSPYFFIKSSLKPGSTPAKYSFNSLNDGLFAAL